MSYAGNVTPRDAWTRLTDDPRAQLIDVRSQPEWTFVGVPDLPLGKKPLLLSWLSYPQMAADPDFPAKLAAQVPHGPDTPLFFLCRSGVRSAAAAEAMAAQGFRHCFNILGGFEGDKDDNGHRGQVNGWKAENLPWQQG